MYKECFEKSVDTVIEALKKIRENDYSSIDNGYEREYYSFPSKEQWQELRKRGGKYGKRLKRWRSEIIALT